MSNDMTFGEFRKFLVGFVSSPWVILSSSVLGILCGIFFPEFSRKLSLGGELYLNYITLLTIPLIICALSSSLASLIQQNRCDQGNLSLKKMFALLTSILLAVGSIGIFAEIAVNRFFPNQINVERLDELLHAKEKDQADYSIRIFDAPKENTQKKFSLREFLLESLPTNIFQSLSQGDVLHILIFAILFGLALGMIPSDLSRNVIQVLSSSCQACLFLIQWSVYVLPVCLFCMLSNMISILDYSMLKLVSQFLLVILVLEIFLSVLGLFLWSRTLGISVRSLLKMEGKTLLIALCTCQSFVVMPLLMQDMEEKMHFPREQLKLVVPFAVTMGRFSFTLELTVTAVFISYLYYNTVSWTMLPILLVIAPLLAIGGAWPIISIAVLKILGLPGELGLLLLITINPFVDPLSTFMNITINGLFSSLIMKKSGPVHKQQIEYTGNNIS